MESIWARCAPCARRMSSKVGTSGIRYHQLAAHGYRLSTSPSLWPGAEGDRDFLGGGAAAEAVGEAADLALVGCSNDCRDRTQGGESNKDPAP